MWLPVTELSTRLVCLIQENVGMLFREPREDEIHNER